MGIRFHCNFCDKRLNVKAKQAGEFCICPDCENEIKVPLESTVKAVKKRKKKRRGKIRSDIEVELAPVPTEAHSIELDAASLKVPPALPCAMSTSEAVVVSTSVESPIDVEPPVVVEPPIVIEPPSVVEAPIVVQATDEFDSSLDVQHAIAEEQSSADQQVVGESEDNGQDAIEAEDLVEGELESSTDGAMISAANQEFASEISNSIKSKIEVEPAIKPSVEPATHQTVESVSDDSELAVEMDFNAADEATVNRAELGDSTPEANFGDKEELDSEAALNELLSSDEREIPDDNTPESESFLLAKPVAKIGDDPLKANPDLVWYLRHKRLGEKGPLKARQVEALLEDGKIRVGHIVWREDWNDWVPAEEVFPDLAQPSKDDPAYEIPADLNPHSEFNRKRRAQKRFWMCFNAAAFLLVLVLVYWLTHYGW